MCVYKNSMVMESCVHKMLLASNTRVLSLYCFCEVGVMVSGDAVTEKLIFNSFSRRLWKAATRN